jgi:uncharacterized membrane protein
MVGLGFLSGGSSSWAVDTSADGTVVVGNAVHHMEGYTSKFTEAFIWTDEGGMVGLGSLAEIPMKVLLSEAKGVSGNGEVIVGQTCTSTGTELPFIWDAQNGMRSLSDVLADECGLDLTGWDLVMATGISANGLTIVGIGYNPDGQWEGWIATIPEPATMVLLCGAAVPVLLKRRRKSRA